MSNDDTFPRYLISKQSVDDRALNKDVLAALQSKIPTGRLRITEVGGGIGTMLARLLRWEVIQKAEYNLIDAMNENIEFARAWIPGWAAENGFTVEAENTNHLRVFDARREVRVNLIQADVFDVINRSFPPADLLVAHAFLDLLAMPESLDKLLTLTKDLAWFTINFDGVTILEPVLDQELDRKIELLFHETMDMRPGGGDSRSGRRLFGYLARREAKIEAAGASDWIVYPTGGKYPFEEAYFLQRILNFFQESLADHPRLDQSAFLDWLQRRREQVERGELVYIAHQMDFLVRI